MRVLVCGPRDWRAEKPITDSLSFWRVFGGRLVIIHGGASGADDIADRFGFYWGVDREVYRPDWEAHGKAAGPIRNAEMLRDGKPEIVLAFRYAGEGWTRGTGDMVRKATAAGVPVTVRYHPR